jgi:tetratricopeptide (TPR) repeat protein
MVGRTDTTSDGATAKEYFLRIPYSFGRFTLRARANFVKSERAKIIKSKKEKQTAEYFVKELTRPIHNTNRSVTCDNWFSSIPMFDKMWTDFGIFMTGTLRRNKPEIPPEFLVKKAQNSSIFGFDDNKVLVSFAPKSNRNVLLLSTLGELYNKRVDPKTSKPDVILFYNSTKSGTVLFKQKQYEEALISFTRSLASAPEGSEELFNAYDERSSLLLKLEKYEACLLDLNRAIKARKCPKKLKNILRDRKEDCLAKLLKTGGSADPEELTACKVGSEEWKALCNFDPPNSQLPNASAKIELTKDRRPEWDSAIKATQDIEPGKYDIRTRGCSAQSHL